MEGNLLETVLVIKGIQETHDGKIQITTRKPMTKEERRHGMGGEDRTFIIEAPSPMPSLHDTVTLYLVSGGTVPPGTEGTPAEDEEL